MRKRKENFVAFGKRGKFSRGFAESAKTFAEEGENFAVSPLSVYLSLAVAAECSAGETKEEILSAMDISYDVLSLEFIDFWERLETDGVSIANSPLDKRRGAGILRM